jgi:tRNA (guanine37-N1)-methyltransferase
MELYTALLHYPVYDKNRRIIATAVTNVDVHDISRASATFDVRGFFLVTPVEQQRNLIGEMVDHWTHGSGADYNPRRKQAIERARVVPDLDAAVRQIIAETGSEPVTIATGANVKERMVSFSRMRTMLEEREGSALLVFGTGWGLERSFLEAFDYVLAPVLGPVEYNHLSVRSAVSIILDRLRGRRETQVEEN